MQSILTRGFFLVNCMSCMLCLLVYRWWGHGVVFICATSTTVVVDKFTRFTSWRLVHHTNEALSPKFSFVVLSCFRVCVCHTSNSGRSRYLQRTCEFHWQRLYGNSHRHHGGGGQHPDAQLDHLWPGPDPLTPALAGHYQGYPAWRRPEGEMQECMSGAGATGWGVGIVVSIEDVVVSRRPHATAHY